jgi:hypothetical protein
MNRSNGLANDSSGRVVGEMIDLKQTASVEGLHISDLHLTGLKLVISFDALNQLAFSTSSASGTSTVVSAAFCCPSCPRRQRSM